MNQPKVQSSRFRLCQKCWTDRGIRPWQFKAWGFVYLDDGASHDFKCGHQCQSMWECHSWRFSQINRSESSKARQVHLRQTFLRWWGAYCRAGLSVVVKSFDHELFSTFLELCGLILRIGWSHWGQNKSSTQLVQPAVSCAWFAADLAVSWVHCTEQFFVIARFNL